MLSNMCTGFCLKSIEIGRGGRRLRAIVSQMAGKSERMSRTKFAN